MDEQMGIRSLFQGAKKNLPKFIEQSPHIPVMVNDLIQRAHKGHLNFNNNTQEIESLRNEIQKRHNRNKHFSLGFLVIFFVITAGIFGHFDIQLPLLGKLLVLLSSAYILYHLFRK